MTDDRRSGFDRRSVQERRNELDTRSVEQRQLVVERRSNLDARSGLTQRQTSFSLDEDFVRQVQSANGVEKKLDLIAQATVELSSSLAEIERRVRQIQQIMARTCL